MRYVILGGNGFIGNHLLNRLPESALSIDRVEALEDAEKIMSKLDPNNDVVVNCIGRTGSPNVDWCETHHNETWKANVDTARYVSQACNEHGIRLVNIGTGCIFQGEGPVLFQACPVYHFDDEAEPNYFGSFYSISKYAAEREVNKNPLATTLRIRMPITDTPHPKNFINKVLGYNRIINKKNSVTFLSDLERMVQHVVDNNIYGPVNAVHPEPFSVYDIFKAAGKDEREYDVITTDELRQITVADRSNTILYPRKLINSGFRFPSGVSELERCVQGALKK